MKFGIFKAEAQASESKADIQTGVINLASRRSSWVSRHTGSLVRSGFMSNPVTFRAVRMVAEAAAHVRVDLQDDQMRYEEHPVLRLLQNPSKGQSRAAFFETLYGHYLLSGQAYIEAARDDLGEITALYILRPDRVRVLLGDDGWPEGYEYQVGGQKRVYRLTGDQSPILQIRSFHPQDDHYGLSPIIAAADAIEVHNAASSWSKALLDNAARPSGAIIYRGADGQGHLSQNQYARLIDELETYHQGARNAGRPLLLEGGLDWKPMGFSPSDMEFHRTKEMAAREIALAFGVPPMLLGIPGDNTYSNYQEANRAFYRLTVLPLVERVMSSLNIWLLADEEANFQVDMESIPALANEREADWRRVASADFLTTNEKRRLLGFPPMEEDVSEQSDA